MRKTNGATKAHNYAGYWKHLRKYAKRLANKASRKFVKIIIKNKESDTI